MRLHHALCGAVQVTRPGVVAQTAPERQHLIKRRSGQACDVGETRQKALVIRHDGIDLRLLQHDFGQPHAVGVARLLPG